MSTNLTRITAYTPEPLYKRLEIATSHPKVSKSQIINQALELYLSAEAEAARNNPLIRRLDQMSREQERLRQRLIVMSEGHALFVRYFLTMVPPPEPSELKASRAQGEHRFEGYVSALKVLLSDKNSHLFNGIEDAFLAENDFLTEEELDALDISQADTKSGGHREQP